MFFYSIGIKIYLFIIYLASAFNKKASKAIKGRKDFFKINLPDSKQKYIWFHCASLGEFEQGRPIIERIKKQNPEKKVLLSFFSPSGFEIRKDYSFADKIVYLPFDSASNAKKFLSIFSIEMAVFVKYDVWPFYMKEILKRKIPVFLTSAVFRKDQFFFKWYGAFFLKLLTRMNIIFVQNEESISLAKSKRLNNAELAGDARVDRVEQIKLNIQEIPSVKQFIRKKKCIVLGSVYESETVFIKYLVEHLGEDFKIIIVPHSVDSSTLNHFKKVFPQAELFTNLNKKRECSVLLVDHVGSLNQIYQYASGVYVGGGYDKGIHNILEPAVFNIPIFFGSHYHKFPEAFSLLKENLAFVENDSLQLAKCMVTKLTEDTSPEFFNNSKKWFKKNSGATDLIYSKLSRFF